MIYVFAAVAIYTLFRKKDQLLQEKRNLFLYLILSICGITLGIIYLRNPYLQSFTIFMENLKL